MPFTVSHPAAVAIVWPFARRIGIRLTTLAVGAMIPDFEFFLHLTPTALFSHTIPGLLLFCVPAGLMVVLIWDLLIGPAVRELVGIRTANYAASLTLRWWALSTVGVFAGAVTHLLWDGVTHGGYWGAAVWPGLLEPALVIGDTIVPWFNLLQHLSTMVGGLIVLQWLVAMVRREGDIQLLLQTPRRVRAVLFIVSCGVLAALANGARGPFGIDFWTLQRLLGRTAVGGLLGLGLGALLLALQRRAAAKHHCS